MARSARRPMPCHDGTGVSAAVETSSRVLRPIVRAVERIRLLAIVRLVWQKTKGKAPSPIGMILLSAVLGALLSAAVETSSRVLRPIVRAVERIRATTQGRTPERKASTPAYLSKSWMRAAD